MLYENIIKVSIYIIKQNKTTIKVGGLQKKNVYNQASQILKLSRDQDNI